MSKTKIIILISAVIAIIVISNYITYVETAKSFASGVVSIEESNFHDDIVYINVTQKILQEFNLEDGFIEADSYMHFNPDLDRLGGIAHTTQVSLSNQMTKQFESFLQEQNSTETPWDNRYYLEYDGKYFWVGVWYCYPQCPHFID